MYHGLKSSAFVYAFLIVFLLSKGSVPPKTPADIVKFLNTSEPIWTFTTTSTSRAYDCKVDTIDNIDREKVRFRRFYGYRKVIISDWMQFLVGNFYYSGGKTEPTSKTYDAMKVSRTEAGTPLDKKTLVFASRNYTCGIFAVDDLVNGGQATVYELRVKNSSLEAVSTTDCYTEYNKMAKTAARKLYLPTCQDVLVGMDNIVHGGSPDNGAVQ